MKAYDASFPLNVNFFMKNLKTLIGATRFAKAPKESSHRGRRGKLQRTEVPLISKESS